MAVSGVEGVQYIETSCVIVSIVYNARNDLAMKRGKCDLDTAENNEDRHAYNQSRKLFCRDL